MLEIRTADGAGRGTIDKTFSARGKDGKHYEAARYSLHYADGRTLEFFTDGQELKDGIARGEIKIYGRILNS